jgi:hypothetical protein
MAGSKSVNFYMALGVAANACGELHLLCRMPCMISLRTDYCFSLYRIWCYFDYYFSAAGAGGKDFLAYFHGGKCNFILR